MTIATQSELEARIDILRDENRELRREVKRLHDALVRAVPAVHDTLPCPRVSAAELDFDLDTLLPIAMQEGP